MRVLVIGGTQFIGPHVVTALLRAGHEVTVFNRGVTPDTLPAEVERLRGDRVANDLAALNGRSFDATIDMCGFFGRAMHAVFDALASPGHYCYVSSVSAYASFGPTGQDESAPLAVLDDPETEDAASGAYGGLKALCEEVVRERAASCSILRLGIVVGPGDTSDRFTFWAARVAAGGTIIAPVDPREPLQWIDARDVADFACRCVEHRTTGTLNLVTPPRAHTIGSLIAVCQRVANVRSDQLWLDEASLEELGVKPWIDLPCWLPSDGDSAGFATFDCSRAVAKGLQFRSVETTVRDLLDWWSAQPSERRQLRAGIGRADESAIVTSCSKSRPIASLGAVADRGAVAALVTRAFGQPDESRLVDALRADVVDTFEVLVSIDDALVGHVMFSRLDVSPDGLVVWALAPMAVDPDRQRTGIGELLGRVGIEACRARGADVICVLGHPEYYPRFGFSADLGARVPSAYSGAGAAWMALELTPGAVDRVEDVRFPRPFDDG